MAVPAGEYEIRASLDLTPLFGVLTCANPVSVYEVPADILERRLAELGSENAALRRNALIDLRNFRDDGDVVVPAVLKLVSDADESIRGLALSVLQSFPKQAVGVIDVVLPILESKTVSTYERSSAGWIVARFAPASERAEKALAAALEAAEENYRPQYENMLKQYRTRTAPPPKD